MTGLVPRPANRPAWFRHSSYDAMPDGNVIVISPLRGQSIPLTLVVNWYRRLDRDLRPPPCHAGGRGDSILFQKRQGQRWLCGQRDPEGGRDHGGEEKHHQDGVVEIPDRGVER